jgi:DNA polymerase I
MTRQDKWEAISNPNCDQCGLCETAQKVCIIGRGDLRAKIFLVGEAPGFREDDIGKPFAGRSGRLLDDILIELGANRRDVYISNIVHCRPPDNRTPSKKEMQACFPYLEKELDVVRPNMIVALGNTALKALTRRSGITKYRGTTFDYQGNGWYAKILPTFHPAAILRNPRNLEYLVQDLERAFGIERGDVKEERVKYKIIRSAKELKRVVEQIEKKGIFSFDVETTGLKWWSEDQLLCSIGLSWKKGYGVCIPVDHSESDSIYKDGYTWRQAQVLLRRIFSNYDIEKVGHNLKFDAKWLNAYGIKVNGNTFDTMLAHHLLNENAQHGLDSLSLEYTKYGEYWREVNELGLVGGAAYNIPLKKLARYNCTDAEITLRLRYLFRKQLKEIPKLWNLFNVLVMPVSRSLTEVELNGIAIDMKFLASLMTKFEKELADRYEGLRNYKAAKRVEQVLALEKNGKGKKKKFDKINFNSSQQMDILLFGDDGFGFNPIRQTDAGSNSSDEATLIELSLKKKNGKFPLDLLEYRKVQKLYSTYVKGLYQHIGEDNKVHPNFKISGTVTGRLSCSDPNMQNIPRTAAAAYDSPLKAEIKKLFIAPKGYVLLQVDYSQAELRIMTHVAGEDKMAQWFRDGKDVHLAVAALRLKKPESEVTKAERKEAKTVNFGIIYCVQKKTLAANLSSPSEGIFYSENEAALFIKSYFKLFPKIEKAMHRLQAQAQRDGYVETLFGRRRRLPDLQSDSRAVREEALRQAVNSPIQGSAGEFTTFAMALLLGYVDGKRRLPQGVTIINNIHDALLFQVPIPKLRETARIAKRMCENLPTEKYFGVKLSVPMVVDAEKGPNWGGDLVKYENFA